MQSHLRKCSRKQTHSFVIIICLNKKPNNNGFATFANKFTSELLTQYQKSDSIFILILHIQHVNHQFDIHDLKRLTETLSNLYMQRKTKTARDLTTKMHIWGRTFFFPFFKQQQFLLTLITFFYSILRNIKKIIA